MPEEEADKRLRLLRSRLILCGEAPKTFQEAKPVGYASKPFTNRRVGANVADANVIRTARSANKPVQEASNEHTDGFHQL
jgi:hypothetical protein